MIAEWFGRVFLWVACSTLLSIAGGNPSNGQMVNEHTKRRILSPACVTIGPHLKMGLGLPKGGEVRVRFMKEALKTRYIDLQLDFEDGERLLLRYHVEGMLSRVLAVAGESQDAQHRSASLREGFRWGMHKAELELKLGVVADWEPFPGLDDVEWCRLSNSAVYELRSGVWDVVLVVRDGTLIAVEEYSYTTRAPEDSLTRRGFGVYPNYDYITDLTVEVF